MPTNVEAYSIAKSRAKRNGRAQIVWKDRAGSFRYGPATPITVKKALLAVGTQGRFTEISPRGTYSNINWHIGCLFLRNFKYL